MARRRSIWTGTVAALGMGAAAIGLSARGQDRPVPEPKYYQGKVSPAPMTPPVVKPVGHPNTWTPPAGSKPRITSPVVAGPNGVRKVADNDPVSVGPPPAALPPGPPSPVTGRSLPPVAAPLPPPALPTIPPAAGDEKKSPLPDPVPLAPPALPSPGPQPVIGLPGPAVGEKTPPPTLPVVSEPKITPAEPVPPAPAGVALPARTAPNLTIDAVAPESVGVGQPLTYELVVRNVGTAAVTNVRVEDELPARATLVSSEPSAETSGGRLGWSIGTMEPGIERRIKVTVRPADEGEIASRAVVTFASAVEARVKVTRPKISVAMTAPEGARVGDKVPFQIRLSNTGTGSASRVMLQARFSEGLSHPHGQLIEAEIANLAAGETKTLTLEAQAVQSGPHQCVLTAAGDGSPPETAKAGVTLVEPKLVVKQAGPARCLVKGEPAYQIELSNPGTAATDPIQVWAALPAGFEFVAATDGGSFAETNRSVGWRLPGLPAGATRTVSMKLRASAPTDGAIRTVATAQPDAVQPAGGVPPANAPARGLESRVETVVKAEGVPALRFEVADVEDPVEAGKEAVYEIRVVNQGTGPCTNVQLTAELAEGTVAVGPAAGPTGTRIAGQQIVFEPIPQLGVKAEAVYRVRVRGTVPGDHRFRVRLACGEIRSAVVKEENTRFYKE